MRSGDVVTYYVKFSDGDVQRASLDELDAWFQAGSIDERTMVLASDGVQWTRLGALAGIEEEQPPPVRRAPAPYVPAPMASHRPVSIDLTDLGADESNPFGARRRGSTGSRTGAKTAKRGWAVALVGLATVGALGSVVALEQPAWVAPYWGRLAQATGLRSSAASQVPAPVFPAVTSAPEAPPTPTPQPWVNSSPVPPPVAAAVPPPVTPVVVDPRRHAGHDTPRGPSKAKQPARSAGGAGRSHPAKRGASAPFTTGGSKYDPLNAGI